MSAKVSDQPDPLAGRPAPVSAAAAVPARRAAHGQVERGGPKGPEPTRFGDWERNGKCVDF